jgi:hypothetical protein
MEMDCVEAAREEDRGTPISDRCHKRTYYRKMGKVIGACSGEKTEYIYVEYHNTGPVHGRPMCKKLLEEKIRRGNQ